MAAIDQSIKSRNDSCARIFFSALLPLVCVSSCLADRTAHVSWHGSQGVRFDAAMKQRETRAEASFRLRLVKAGRWEVYAAACSCCLVSNGTRLRTAHEVPIYFAAPGANARVPSMSCCVPSRSRRKLFEQMVVPLCHNDNGISRLRCETGEACKGCDLLEVVRECLTELEQHPELPLMCNSLDLSQHCT